MKVLSATWAADPWARAPAVRDGTIVLAAALTGSLAQRLPQRFMSQRAGSTVVEVRGSHAIYVSQPAAVAALIAQAAKTREAMAHAS